MNTHIRHFLEPLLLGRVAASASGYERKVALLRGGICLLAIFICAVYLLIDYSEGVVGGRYFYGFLIASSLVALVLNRKGYYRTSTTVFMVAASLVIYVMTSNDVLRTGVYLYLILLMLGAFALFGFQNIRWAVGFSLLILIQFMLAYVYNVRPIVLEMSMSPEAAEFSIINNFVIAFITCAVFFYFVLQLNHTTEKQLRDKNQLLQKTNEELDRFVYSTSHDMRAPLSSVLGLVEIAKRTTDPRELGQCLDMMRARVNNLQDFIREIRDYSRNERQELRQEEIPVAALIREIVNDLRFDKEAIHLSIELKIDESLTVVADGARMKMVMGNLISNAIRYRDGKKESPFVKIQANQREGVTAIAVEDNGIGIPPEHQGKIFDMFYRGTEKSEGSGLGLYIAQEAAHKMGGKILALSSPGLGSAFTLVLPFRPQ
ncbi:MAG: HAMP domain-containing histidine kinase [Cyclobacteriaceae bacterium]|jgi:signal transduction histidine kinase|nr:HAMP domain-containing histidine kinase [Cyclobacteriaceae bacterium]